MTDFALARIKRASLGFVTTWFRKQRDINTMTDLPKTSAPAGRALACAGIDSLETLAHFKRSQIASLHGIGPNALGKLETAMRAAGLRFQDD